jgi:PIN domain nuclease of toxin-antitoxin system
MTTRQQVRGSYLLDSNILVWLDSGSSRLTDQIRQDLRYAERRYLSAATAWELSLKQAAGKLTLGASISTTLAAFRLEELPVLIRHGERAATLPFHHSDPFDRIIVAQALEESLILITADERLADYCVPILLV